MNIKFITDNPEVLTQLCKTIESTDSNSYLSGCFNQQKNIRIINLCNNYDYQSLGYYVSLLAEARHHKVIPNVLTIQDFHIRSTLVYINDILSEEIQKSLHSIHSDHFELSVYFGKNLAQTHNILAKKLYGILPLPLFKIDFVKKKLWEAKKISLISLDRVPHTHYEFLSTLLDNYIQRRTPVTTVRRSFFYDIAMLHNSEEKNPPSNKKAIEKFIKLGRKNNINIELIQKDDFKSLSEYDALFIRETTAVNHHTYRFARKAAAEGLVVIDDPVSILKCSNKVYLAELMQTHNISTPRTTIINKNNYRDTIKTIDYPCVIKLPDGAFSLGVKKASNETEAIIFCKDFFKISELVIIQEFAPSEFDWRIGIIDNKALFACRYYMAKSHWQIYNWHNSKKSEQEGLFDTLPIEETPQEVINTALKATKLIGNGLYGVDLKQIGNKVHIIEINDNPNIDAGVEDCHLGDNLYEIILTTIKNRLDDSHGLNR